MVIDWKDFMRIPLKMARKIDRIIMRIESTVGDCFGPEYREHAYKC